MTFSVEIELLSKTFGLFRLAQIVGHVVFDLGACFDLAQEIHKRRYVNYLKKHKTKNLNIKHKISTNI